jgi:enediyne biosynthesis protein E4
MKEDDKPPLKTHDDDGEPPGEDAAMGQAVRWTVGALLLIVVAGAALLWVNRRADLPRSSHSQGTVAGRQSPGRSMVNIPELPFTDITARAGITFVHTNGALGEKLLPETMGGGVAFLDFDNDGDQDLLFVNSGNWPWRSQDSAIRNPQSAIDQSLLSSAATVVLYRNDTPAGGPVKFTDVTAASGLRLAAYGMGVAAGDYNNDGRVDVFLTALGGNRLFRNEGNGRFSDATATAGVGGAPEAWSTSAAFLDFDNDGDLDLFVANYIQWSRELDHQIDYRLPGIGRAYGPPMHYPGAFPYLYRNEGGGRFTDVSAAAGVQVRNHATGLPLGKSLGVAPVDVDADGWIDLIVANDTVQNFVFRNQRNGTFQETGALTGLAYDSFGGARGAMGIDAGRFHHGDTLGILIGNFANEMTALYVSQRNQPVFTDEAIARGIGAPTRSLLTFGVFFFDADLDGWLDLLTANGHIEDEIEKAQPDQRYRQPTQLFWNAGGAHREGGFVAVPPEKCGPDFSRPIVGRGAAFADVDGDGDADVVITQINGPPLLLRNDLRAGAPWVRFKLEGVKSNRDALGAWIEVRSGHRVMARQVMPARGYLSHSELPVTFGLGDAARLDEVAVVWPGGAKQRLDVAELRLNALNVVRETP